MIGCNVRNLRSICSCHHKGCVPHLQAVYPLNERNQQHSFLRANLSGIFQTECQEVFFTNRVVKHWNSLTREVVNAPSLSMFTRHLDNIFNMLQLLVSPEVDRQLNQMTVVDSFQKTRFYPILFYSVLESSYFTASQLQ